MSGFYSPETAGYINNVRNIIEYVDVPMEKAVLLSSGAIYLGARAVEVSSRFPQDIDLSIAPEYLETALDRLPGATFISEGGKYFRSHIGEWQVDIGAAQGAVSHDRLRAGAQFTPDGLAFSSLNHVIEYKRARGLEKDSQDIDFIERLMQRFQPEVEGSLGLACTVEAAFGNTDASYQASRLLPSSLHTPIGENEKYIVGSLGDEMLRRMGVRYGTGSPEFQFLQRDPDNRKILFYNTMRHGYEVGNDGHLLGAVLGLGERACYGLWLGGRAHDCDQSGVISNPTLRDGKDELSSAQELIEEARMRGIPNDIAMWAAYFILGTQVVTDGTAVKGQAVKYIPREAFPSEEALLAAQIGASADLGRLYKSPEWSGEAFCGEHEVSLGLLPQRLGYDNPHQLDLSLPKNRAELHKFLIGQQGFVTHHEYPLPQAEMLFAGNLARKRKEWIANQLVAISANDEIPTTWQGLIELTRYLEQQSQFVG